MTYLSHGPDPGSRHKKEPAQVGECVDQFLRNSGLAFMMAHPELHTAWPAIVGSDIAGHTWILGFRRGTLEVAVDSSALMQEIQFHRSALIEDLRAKVRKPFISTISFVLKAR